MTVLEKVKLIENAYIAAPTGSICMNERVRINFDEIEARLIKCPAI